MTEEERKEAQVLREELQRVQVYGIYHDEELIYVGATRTPLRVRLSQHISHSKKRQSEFHRYIQDNGLRLPDLAIEELDFIDEEQALQAYKDRILNTCTTSRPPRKLDYSDVPDEVLLQLGETPDMHLARHYKAPLHKVRNARAKLGIDSTVDRKSPVSVDWQKWDEQLGTKPDREIAEQIGCSLYAVLARRRKMNISSYAPNGGPRTPVPVRKEIAAEYVSTDKSQAEVAEEYGISSGSVSRYHIQYNLGDE